MTINDVITTLNDHIGIGTNFCIYYILCA